MNNPARNLLLLLCFSAVLIASCIKETPDSKAIPEPVDSTAIFGFLASDSACSVTTVNGSFLQGKLPTANDNIQIEVLVSKPGKWSFSTDTLNGFAFAQRGVFTDTGKKLITLNASGTPDTTGTFFFSLTKESLKRHVSVAVLKGNISSEMVPVKSYLQCKIGGVKYYTEAATIGPDNISYGSSGGDTASFSSFLGGGVNPIPAGRGAISLQKGFMFNYQTSTDADFKNFFKPGAYPYASKCGNNVSSGILLFWSDATRQGWVTLKDHSDQAGSSFAIVGIEDGYDSKSIYFVKVKSRFNCRLYNRSTGESTELTDGELVSFFKKPK